MAKDKLTERFRVKPGARLRLKDHDPAWAGTKDMRKLGEPELREKANQLLARNLDRLSKAQEVLWADDRYSLLVILQAMDAAGKDGLIKHVMSGLNPQGCEVSSFKQPSAEELDHSFLWRCMKRAPERGRIGIFNRSYYEEVLVVRVHPEWLEKQKLPEGDRGRKFWEQRFDDINGFERHLTKSGTRVLKFFLHVSPEEQKKRFLERLTNPEKHWKFSAADLAEGAHWKGYMEAYEDALSATSTKDAPWFVIPADHKWVARAAVSEILADSIEGLQLKFPKPTKEQVAAIREARKKLEGE
ncbi:MAG: polyphosphate kinase 2 family protein [Bryobacteraceae bacterium]